jgi:Cys-rich protein (TIGR01571 family)
MVFIFSPNSYFSAGMVWLLMAAVSCQCCVHVPLRKKIHARYNIKPQEGCEDCCITFFCAPCAICQETAQLQEDAHGVALPVATRK